MVSVMTDHEREQLSARYSAARQRALELLGRQEKEATAAAEPRTAREDERAATAERFARRVDEWRGRYDSDKCSLEDWISEATLNPSGYTSVGYVARLVDRLIALIDARAHAQQVEWEADIHKEVQKGVDTVGNKITEEFKRFDKELADAVVEYVVKTIQVLAEDLRQEWRTEMRAMQRGETIDVPRGAKFEPKDADVIDFTDLRKAG
jgi:hypothetical protein